VLIIKHLGPIRVLASLDWFQMSCRKSCLQQNVPQRRSFKMLGKPRVRRNTYPVP
jgi:hypothetical protein